MMTRLQQLHREQIAPQLMQQFGYKNPMQVPKISKITINMGLGEATLDKKVLEQATEELRRITGQHPIITKARKSVASFKIRDNFPVGAKVTLRRERMYEFLDRLINVALPSVRDFRGLSVRSFDGRGNYSLGVAEQTIFPEINFDEVSAMRGMDIAITTTAPTDEEARALLTGFGFPFRQR